MRKNYLLGMALIASLSFYSCDKEVIYVQDGNGVESVTDGAQIITLQVENGGDGLATRAGRPLYSAEAKQTIENVKVIVCDESNEVVYTKDYTEWNDSDSQEYSEDGAHGRKTTIKLEGDDRLGKSQQYTVYAIGYHNNSDYKDKDGNNTLNDLLSGIKANDTFNENLTLKITGSGNAEEIFAGSAELSISDKGAGSANVVLNRQVAGAFAYVKDIPYMEGAKYLKLVASAQNESLVLGNFNSVDLANNGSNTGESVKYVVNGTEGKSGNGPYEICTIDLTQWFKEIKDSNNDNLIDAGENWKNPRRPSDSPAAGTYPTFQKGSVFGGEFVIPFAHVDGKQTLTLQLTNEDGTTVLRSWKVNLNSKDVQLNKEITYWNSDWNSTITDTSANTYSLVRNHLYGIGTRMNDEADPENPDKDPDPEVPGETPDDDKDKPESLNNKQELVLKVNDNWEVIHGMELD